MTVFHEDYDLRDNVLWSDTKKEGCEVLGESEVLSFYEEDAGTTSDRGEKSKKLDLRFCWQYIQGEAVDTDQETENG